MNNLLICFTVSIVIFSFSCKSEQDKVEPKQDFNLGKTYEKFGFSFECSQKYNKTLSSESDSSSWNSFESIEVFLMVESLEEYRYLFDTNSPSIYEDYCDFLEFDSLNFIGSSVEYPLTILVEGKTFDSYNPEELVLSLISPRLSSNDFCVLEIYGHEKEFDEMIEVIDSFKQN